MALTLFAPFVFFQEIGNMMTINQNQLGVILPAKKDEPYQNLYGLFGTIERTSNKDDVLVRPDSIVVNTSHQFTEQRKGKPIKVKTSDVVIVTSDNPLIMLSLKATLTNVLATSLRDSHAIAMRRLYAKAITSEDKKTVDAFNLDCRSSIMAYDALTNTVPTKYQSVNFAARTADHGGLDQVFYISHTGVSPDFEIGNAQSLYKALPVMFDAAKAHHEDGHGDDVLLWNGRFELHVHEALAPSEFVAFLASNPELMNYILLAANAVFDLRSSLVTIEQAVRLIAQSPFATNQGFLRTGTH